MDCVEAAGTVGRGFQPSCGRICRALGKEPHESRKSKDEDGVRPLTSYAAGKDEHLAAACCRAGFGQRREEEAAEPWRRGVSIRPPPRRKGAMAFGGYRAPPAKRCSGAFWSASKGRVRLSHLPFW